MKSTEFQLFLSTVKQDLLTIPSIIFMGILTFTLEEHQNMVLMFVGIQILILLYVQMKFISRKKNLVNSRLKDNPCPSLVDILKMGMLPFLKTMLFILGSLVAIIILRGWGVASLEGWLFGMLLLGFWFYGYRVVGAFSTLYLISDNGLWIYFGLDEIFIPFSKISGVHFSTTVQTNIDKILKGSRTYIPGVRNNNFLVLRLATENGLIKSWFSEIYITPTDPSCLLSMLKEYV